VHRLFAKDRVARARGGLDDRGVGARRRADDHGANVRIGERLRQVACRARAVFSRERPSRREVEIDHPREPRLGMRRQVRRVHRTDESGADQAEIDHGGNRPTATSSRRSWSGERKWMPWMPSAAAAAALAATSSMKTADAGAMRYR